MSYDYEQSFRNLTELRDWYLANESSRNEATTRVHLIDRIFLECLGWDRADLTVEPSQEGKYADYVFKTFRSALIVEAKRESHYFELPTGTSKVELSIQTLRREYPEIKQALDQVAGYCQSRGVQIGSVCNGHQLIAFIATRNDGVAPVDGRAIVFESFDVMLAHFLDLWNALSKPALEENKLFYRLVASPPVVPAKLSASIRAYPGLKQRSVVQADLQVLSDLVFEDVIRSPEVEPEFLRYCYCQSGALSKYALSSKEILATRYASLFEPNLAGPSLVSATTKDGLSPELLDVNVARRPILLLGDVGVGKTTFVRHLVSIDAPEVFEKALFFHLDLGTKGALAVDLRHHIISELKSQLREKHGIDITERNFARGVHDFEIKQFAKSVHGDLRTVDPELFAKREIDFVGGLVADTEAHLRSCILHIAKGRRKQIVVFLDNADQRDEKTQELAFLIAQELASNWQMVVFVALRPETFNRSKAMGALTGYHPKAFTISPPRIDLVLEKRLAFALSLTTGQVPISALQATMSLGKLTTIIKVVRRSLEENRRILEFIENIAAGNVRTALDFITAFIGSGHVDTDQILKIEGQGKNYELKMHTFLTAIILGNSIYYDPNTSPMVNIFDISTSDGKEHFALPLLLGVVDQATGADVKEGFVDTAKVYDAMQSMGFTPDQIDFAVSRGCKKNLIETNARRLPEPGEPMAASIRITQRGLYHIHRAAHEFPYLDSVVVDTPLVDRQSRAAIRDVWTIPDRLNRAETLADYLSKQWQLVNSPSSSFSWPDEVNRLKYQIRMIRGPHR